MEIAPEATSDARPASPDASGKAARPVPAEPGAADPRALVREGDRLLGGAPETRDPARAFELYTRAAALGDAAAMLRVGICHEKGLGVPANPAEAAAWYRRAADLGLPDAQLLLGRAYETGAGVAQDFERAAQWVHRAAEGRQPVAQVLLAQWHEIGRGVERSPVRAYAWANVASVAATRIGNRDAAGKLSQAAVAVRTRVSATMSAEDLAEAQRLSRDWAPGKIPLVLASQAARDPLARALGPRSLPAPRAQATPDASPGGLPGAPRPVPGSLLDDGKAPAPPAPVVRRAGSGTAFYVSRDGHLATNYHVIRGCAQVRLAGGAALAQVAFDEANDLALLRGEPVADAAVLRAGGGIRQGEDALTYGFPLRGMLSSGGQLGAGMVAALAGVGNNASQVQIDVPVQAGNSGGPLLDRGGEVIGVVVSKLDALRVAQVTGDLPQNVSFAVRVEPLRALLDANGVRYASGQGRKAALSNQEIAETARRYTVAIECLR